MPAVSTVRQSSFSGLDEIEIIQDRKFVPKYHIPDLAIVVTPDRVLTPVSMVRRLMFRLLDKAR